MGVRSGTVEGEMRRFSAGFQSLFLLTGVDNMADGHDGVVEDRAGAGKAQDFPDFFLCVRAAAVGR